MKREEKNLQSRQKIIESALNEFSKMGYGLSSINTICQSGGISKGIMYHYFKDKDELYCTCVHECFDALTICLSNFVFADINDPQKYLSAYFDTRTAFFKENPLYQQLFLEATLYPQTHLAQEIMKCKEGFNTLNYKILNTILEKVELRPELKKEDVIETFREYQDFINATSSFDEVILHEERCRRAISILLYGVINF